MPRRGLDRQRVIEGAVELVEDEGAAALGINRVARALGVKPPSLYNHVHSGEDLAWGVVIEGNRRLLAHLTRCHRRDDPAEQLLALALAVRRWALEHVALYTVMATTGVDNDDPDFIEVAGPMIGLFSEPLVQMGVPAAEVVHAVRALRAAIHGFITLETHGQYRLGTSVPASYRRTIAWVLAGITRAPTGPG